MRIKPDGEKGWRRVVASPEPKEILEARAIQVSHHCPPDLHTILPAIIDQCNEMIIWMRLCVET